VQDQKDSGLLEEQQHIFRAEDFAKEEEYTGSLWARVMGAVTGAASGVGVAVGVEKGLFDLGILSEPKSDVADPKAFDAFAPATPGGLEEDASPLEAPSSQWPLDLQKAGDSAERGRIVLQTAAEERRAANGIVFSFDGEGDAATWTPGSSLVIPGFDSASAPSVPFGGGGAPLFNMQSDLFMQSIDDWLSNRRPLFRTETKGRDPFRGIR
jgi:hypothetical protein